MNNVLDIWLKASVEAHRFVDSEFWEANVDTMRKTYIPASDTYVFVEDGTPKGFFCLCGDTLAAMFVAPESQGRGIGGQLMSKAKSLRHQLDLTVYRENSRAVDFYKKCGFTILTERIDDHTGHVEICMGYGC